MNDIMEAELAQAHQRIRELESEVARLTPDAERWRAVRPWLGPMHEPGRWRIEHLLQTPWNTTLPGPGLNIDEAADFLVDLDAARGAEERTTDG